MLLKFDLTKIFYQIVCLWSTLINGTQLALATANFDFFMYAEHYPATICLIANKIKHNSCVYTKSLNQFTVHGLWPSSFDHKSPSFCNGTEFDVGKLSTFRTELERNWPNLVPNQPIEEFWQYEWDKHGKCALSNSIFKDERDYFYKATTLNTDINLFRNFEKQEIKPSSTKHYTVDQIKQALTQFGHTKPKLECIKDRNTGDFYLAAVRLCFNYNMSSEISCSEGGVLKSMTSSLPAMLPCPPNRPIIYPPFDNDSSTQVKKDHLTEIAQAKMTIIVFVILLTSVLVAAFVDLKRFCTPTQNPATYNILTEDLV